MDKTLEVTRNFDLRSLITGLLLGICLILISGQITQQKLLNERGKYQLCQAGNDSYGVFIIDTQTGKTWRLDNKSTIVYGTPQDRSANQISVQPNE